MPSVLCIPGKGLTVEYFLELMAERMCLNTQYQSAGACLLYSVLPKTACSVELGIYQLSTKL